MAKVLRYKNRNNGNVFDVEEGDVCHLRISEGLDRSDYELVGEVNLKTGKVGKEAKEAKAPEAPAEKPAE